MIQIDMEKPKFCWWMDGNDYRKCPMVDGKNGCCLHSNVSYATWEEQHKHCPLHEVTDIHTGYVGVDDDYPVSVKQVLNITAELGALETQSRVRELPRYQVTDPDTVSRQAAIEAVKKHYRAHDNDLLELIAFDIERLPSAQPEKRTDKRTETHACDLISRQAVIDAILAVTGNSSVRELYEHVQEHGLSDMWSGGVNAAIDIIIAVPSTQPEIIRCKDCKFWTPIKHTNIYWCKTDDGLYDLKPSPNDFCSRAERRTDEHSD